jgi:hypothetical protein
MKTAQIVRFTFLASFLLAVALALPLSVRAAAGNVQACQPSTSCTIGEFLYDDEYSPITDASCTITTRYPNGTLFHNSEAMTSSVDGWYSEEFTAPATTGLYRSQVCCTSGTDYLCLDKTFEVKDDAALTQGEVADAVWNAQKSSYTAVGSFGEVLQNAIASADDIAAATWSYSGRTLSDFGTLITSIWSSGTRTLTGAGLDSGSLAKQSDVSDLNTKIDAVQDKANNIKTDTESLKDRMGSITGTSVSSEITGIKNSILETRSIVEQVVNKPTFINVLENGTQVTNDLQSKIESTKKISTQILTNTQYLGSRAGVIKDKWASLKQPEISSQVAKLSSVLGQEKDNSTKSSIFSEINWLTSSWSWSSVKSVALRTKSAKIAVDVLQKEIDNNGKTKNAYRLLENVISATNKLQLAIGNNDKLVLKNTLFADAFATQQYISSLDEKSKSVDGMLASINGTISASDLSNKSTGGITFNGLVKNIDQLTRDILSLNKLPKLELSTFNKLYPALSVRDAKNKVLGLKGVIIANKQLLTFDANKAFASTWLEEGSIVFKTLVTNPSTIIRQEAPIKYYLPAEVKEENIMKIDEGLEVGYDSEKAQFYVSGTFELAPGETKTVSVEVDDSVYIIPEEIIAGLRKQVEELAMPLQNTSYFGQGVTIKGDINVSLDKVEALMKSANTPDAKIKNFRDAEIEMKSIYEKRDRLQELVASASSVGTLFGFVGGTQTLAVWGMIIIMAAGFVFLALYMKVLRNNEKIITSTLEKKESKIKEETKDIKRHIRPMTKIIVGAVVIALLTSFVSGIVVSKNLFATKKNETTSKPIAVKEVKEEKVLGIKTVERIKILVPQESIVNIYSLPDISSTTVKSLIRSTEVAKIEAKDAWVKIAILAEDKNPSQIEGWIEKEFVQEVSEASMEESVSVFVNDEISHLKVRSGPSTKEKEVGKAYPGEEYALIDEIEGWFQIELADGGLGWISKDFSHK